jgi:hypothetical protein
MNAKPKTVEIPPNATDQVVRIQMEEVAKAVRQARASSKDRVRVTVEQGK